MCRRDDGCEQEERCSESRRVRGGRGGHAPGHRNIARPPGQAAVRELWRQKRHAFSPHMPDDVAGGPEPMACRPEEILTSHWKYICQILGDFISPVASPLSA